MNGFDQLFAPVTLNFAHTYLLYANFIDTILAFIIFLSIGQIVFTSRYKSAESSKGGKMVAIAIALALTFGFAIFELQTGFTFAKLDALAAIALLIVLGVFVYELLLKSFGDGEKHKRYAAAFSYLLIYGMFLLPFAELYGLLKSQYRFVWSVLGIIFLTSFIICILGLVELFKSGKKDEERHDSHEPSPQAAQHHIPETPPKEKPAEPPKAPSPIHLVITHPSEREQVVFDDQPIPIEVYVAGAKKPELLVTLNGKPLATGKETVHVTIPPQPMGEYHIHAIATDKETGVNAEAERTFVVKLRKDYTEFSGSVAGIATDTNGDAVENTQFYLWVVKEKKYFTDEKGHAHSARVQTVEGKTTFVFDHVRLGMPFTVLGVRKVDGKQQPGQLAPFTEITLTSDAPTKTGLHVVFESLAKAGIVTASVRDSFGNAVPDAIVILHKKGEKEPARSINGALLRQKSVIIDGEAIVTFEDVPANKEFEIVAYRDRGNTKEAARNIMPQTVIITAKNPAIIAVIEFKNHELAPGPKGLPPGEAIAAGGAQEPAGLLNAGQEEKKEPEVPPTIQIIPSSSLNPERQDGRFVAITKKALGRNAISFDVKSIGAKGAQYVYRFSFFALYGAILPGMDKPTTPQTIHLGEKEIRALGIAINGVKTVKGKHVRLKEANITPEEDFMVIETEAIRSAKSEKEVTVLFGTDGELDKTNAFRALTVGIEDPYEIIIRAEAFLMRSAGAEQKYVEDEGRIVAADAIVRVINPAAELVK